MRLPILLCLAAMLAAPAAAAAPPVSPEQAFTAEMIARLRPLLPDTVLKPKPDDPFAILATGGEWKEAEINVQRIFALCQHAPAADCERARQEFVAGVTEKRAPPAASALRLIVRDKEYVDYIQQRYATAPDEAADAAVVEPIGDTLYAVLALDSPQSIELVGEKSLKALGLSRAEAWAQALKQTQAILPPLPKGSELATGARAYQDQPYLGSLLLDLPAWREISRTAGPDLFVTVVSDSFVFVGTLAEGPKLEAFKRAVAEDCAEQPRCISPDLHRFRNGHWTASPPAARLVGATGKKGE
jgi:hypothetical protein